uniref:Uncharacterized protein n=1 Tax=Anguilla anguilla TaxID=7936 RepID=A0A0E9QV79_ANGAN
MTKILLIVKRLRTVYTKRCLCFRA